MRRTLKDSITKRQKRIFVSAFFYFLLRLMIRRVNNISVARATVHPKRINNHLKTQNKTFNPMITPIKTTARSLLL